MADEFTRIPVEITADSDRRELAAILTAYGLTVRIVKVRLTQRGTPKKFVEFCLAPGIATEASE